MSQILENISIWFCREFHNEITRPVHGHYYCIKCGRKYKSPWN